MIFLNEILKRRIPQILGSYFIAGSSLILFIDWLVSRYGISEYYVTLVMFGILSIIPSVLILAYFHGAPGKDEWTQVEKIGIPINILFIGIMILYLILSYKVIQKINLFKDDKIKLILVGSISIILLQSFIHFGVNIRMLPTTGMTLPFLSYGGSSIISTSILSGIILNLTKRKISK